MSDAGHIAPQVTVLMPVYNAARFLREAIDSVLAQSFKDFELLVVDDGSIDDSVAIVNTYSDPRIRLVELGRNRGLVAALNTGLDAAEGEFIARMDADDVMHPDRLAIQMAYLSEHPDIDVVAAFVEHINTRGEVMGAWSTDRATITEAQIRAMMPRTNCIAHPTVLMRTTVVRRYRYQGGIEDWDLWLRMLSRGHRFGKIPRPLVRYRIHPTSIMGDLKAQVPLEMRLIRSRREFLLHEWGHFRFSALHIAVLKAQARTRARWIRDRWVIPFLRGIKRLVTYSPVALLREQRMLKKALAAWRGRHVFTFSYLSTGGAESVHADIMDTVADQHPLILVTGFSRDNGNAERFAGSGRLVEIPRLLHHPFTAAAARARIVRAINGKENPVLFGSNTDHFFAWLPFLRPGTRAIQLIHAFLYQPNGNRKHKAWSALFPLVERYVFVARQAMTEFNTFLRANNLDPTSKTVFIPNAVHRSGSVRKHDRMGLVFVGRDSGEKRLHLFLDLCAQLDRLAPGRLRYTVVGTGPVPGHPFVTFRGHVTDQTTLAEIYAEHDALVLTSEREGFPMVIMEAMAQGLVIISTPVGDVPQRTSTDFAVITSSIEPVLMTAEMLQAVNDLDADRQRLQRMKEAALVHARREFDLNAFRERYRSLLMSPASST